MKNTQCVVVTGLALVLGACGGGGGGGGGSPPPEFLAVGTNESLRALTRTQTFQALSVDGRDDGTVDPVTATAISETTTNVTWRPRVANPNSDFQISVAVNNPALGISNFSRTFDTRSGQGLIDTSGPYTTVRLFGIPDLTAANNIAFLLMYDPAAGAPRPDLQYQTFGFWQDRVTATGTTVFGGVFSIGVVTAADRIPSSGGFTYTGTMVGSVVTNGNTANPVVQQLDAQVSVLANFDNRTVSFDSFGSRIFDNNTEVWVSAPVWNVRGVLDIAPGANKFTGRVDSVTGPSHSGPATGRFYGLDAQELGGALNTADPGGTLGIQGAAFGARKP